MSDLLPAVPEPGALVSAEQITEIERAVALAIPRIDQIAVLDEGRARIAALEAYLRSKGLQRPALGAQRMIEARIGQLLGDAAHGGDRRSGDFKSVVPDLKSKDDRHDFRLLARALDGDVELDEDGWRKTRRALLADIRRGLGLTLETPPLPVGRFRCIVADPPWRLDTGPDKFGGTIEHGHDALDYDQMCVDDIAALDVEEHAADDAHLYLWTVNRYLEHAYDVVRAWGFKPSVLLTWCKKPRGVGLGDTFRLTTEFVLFARRGNLDHQEIVPTTWFEWARGRHSAKPAAFYEMVEAVTPASSNRERLEMFARQPRTGWSVWGHEVT